MGRPTHGARERVMNFDARERAKAKESGLDALVAASRDARERRARERELIAAAVTCQRRRRASRARRDAERTMRETLDAMATSGTVTTDAIQALVRAKVSRCGLERAFKVIALALRDKETIARTCDLATRRALCVEALATCSNAEARERVPALVACGARLASGLCERDERLASSLGNRACEALAAALGDERFGGEHRLDVARQLASLALMPLDSDPRSNRSHIRTLIRVPRLRKNLPGEAVRKFDEPRTMRLMLEACSDGFNRDADVAIENVMETLCDGDASGKGENVRLFARENDENAFLALRALTGLSASARTQMPDWFDKLAKAPGWRTITVSALVETWFLTALTSDKDGKRVSSPEKAAAATSLYAELSRASAEGVYAPCAFSSGYLHSLWRYLARKLSLSSEVMSSDHSAWVAKTFERDGVLDLALDEQERFAFFCSAYTYRLIVLRDKQFFDEQKPFSLSEQRAIAVSVNTLCVRSHLSPKSHEITIEMRRTLSAASKLLHALTTRDARRSFAPQGMWLAPNTIKLQPTVAASTFQSYIENPSNFTQITGLLDDCPHAIAFDDRVHIFRELIKADRNKAGFRPQAGGVDAEHRDSFVRPVAQMTLRRETVLEDSLSTILSLGSKSRGRILVKFVNAAGQEEAGIDAGGLFKELLSLVTERGLDPNRGLFTTNSFGQVYVSPRAGDTHEGLLLLEMIGIMIGKGIYEGILQDINMAPFFAAHILGTPRTIDDIPSLDEELAHSLVQILEYSGDVADLCLDFTCSEEVYGQLVTRELVQGGREIDVTSANKLLYIHLLADYHLNRRIATPMNAFIRGLRTIINPRWIGLFNAKELSLLLSGGESAIDVDDWERHTRYSGGYTARSTAVRNFWRIVRTFSPDLRQDVLKFVTSSPRPPLQGFKHLNPPFVIHKVPCEASVFAMFGGADVGRLPSASTCFNMLKLPNYRRRSTLEKCLEYAARSRAGFELS